MQEKENVSANTVSTIDPEEPKDDLELIEKIDRQAISYWHPIDRMPAGDEARRNDPIGVTHIHHFFTQRNLVALSYAWSYAKSARAKFMLTSLMYKSSILCSPWLFRVQGDKLS